MGRADMQKAYNDYTEAEMTTVTSHFGDGRCSEWVGEKPVFLSSRKMHGYRVTILSKESRISVICRCPESNWTVLKPAFERIITSLKDAPNGE